MINRIRTKRITWYCLRVVMMQKSSFSLTLYIQHVNNTAQIADPMGLSVEAAAQGVISVVNSNMARAIRVITVEKGHNPSDFTLVAYGGAGPLHAVHLAQEGKQVYLVEMRDILAPDCNIRHRPILMKMIDELVTVHLGHAGVEVTAEGLLCKASDGSQVLIPGQTVICAVGQRANRADAQALHTAAPFVREVGDCIRPANITKAVYEGYHAALDI